MTPTEYAREQGWRVGDLLAWRHLTLELTAIGKTNVLVIYACWGTGDIELAPGCDLDIKRIGRVLRPNNGR